MTSITANLTLSTKMADTLFALESPQFGRDLCRDVRRLLSELTKAAQGCGLLRRPPRAQALGISRMLFREHEFRFRQEKKGERFTLCGTLLDRGGSCLGLTTVYVCLGEALGLPLRPILFESHIAVGHCGASPPLHIETTRHGAVLAKRWVDRLYGSPTLPDTVLTREQFLAVHLSNRAAFVLAQEGRLREALDLADTSVELFPTYTAAWINRAAILLQLDDLPAAEASLARAVELEPGSEYQRAIGRILGQLLRRSLASSGKGTGLEPQEESAALTERMESISSHTRAAETSIAERRQES
ncbi:MAG: tetratricopeptide repeat protein [Planctomycetes bacterium]|nr:tetratricopeptide repeat protein [Planctomycetota bacterium]